MKTLVIGVAILGSSLFNTSLAKGTLDINKELKKVVRFDNNQLTLEKNETEFVKVSFKVNYQGEIEILGMNYSDEKVKSQLLKKLSNMKIKKSHNSEKVYNYNFTFKKL
tara:strand:- start:1038 stop:1364 length:327 start_codon:yes stop_codon:yes gene_type:complete